MSTPAPEPKIWQLIAPDWGTLDTIWHHQSPFVLWPVGNQPLLAHWMDEAVRRGVDLVEFYVADRPGEVRAWIENGAYWSRGVRLVPIGSEDLGPEGAERIDHLPGCPAPPAPKYPAELPRYWFSLQEQWLASRSVDTVSVDHQHPTGGWIGPQAKIHPSARLIAPFWIGARARIGPDCEVGPNALISEGAILDDCAQVEEACVLPRTYLGRNTRLFQAAADQYFLLDFRRGCRAEITEPFIMGPAIERSHGSGLPARFLALLCWLLLAPFTWLLAQGRDVARIVRGWNGENFSVTTSLCGPLWFRRASWLRHIAAGRLRWIGILPRGIGDLAHVPEDIARALRHAPEGMFSLADVHGCHEPTDPEEWIHAAYQASSVGGNAGSVVLRNLWKVAWS